MLKILAVEDVAARALGCGHNQRVVEREAPSQVGGQGLSVEVGVGLDPA